MLKITFSHDILSIEVLLQFELSVICSELKELTNVKQSKAIS